MTEFKKWLDHNKLYLEAAYKVLDMEEYTLRAWELAQPQWQPIETAPKGVYSLHKDDPEWVDPPRILLSTPEGVVTAYWDYYYDGGVGGHGYRGNETAWVTDGGELVEDIYDTPMYWMPLPQPPK